MRIQHNIAAMNAYRNYSNNTSSLSKNLEKLSSGYRINRAGDDAAGLAISEKMRAQITGLQVAQKNAKDGISLVQTAEGALTEVHDMLNRMYELAEQSANGTYDDSVDRAQLQKEVDSLRTEINRIADSANFNGITLLDGSRASGGAGGTSFSLPSVSETLGAGTVLHKTVATDVSSKTSFSVELHNLTVKGSSASASTAQIDVTIGGISVTASVALTNGKATVGAIAAAIASAIGSSATIGGVNFTVSVADGVISFEQTSAAVTKDDLVNGYMAVTVVGSGTTTVEGDYNKSTTNIKNASLVSTDRLASTYFDLTDRMVGNGATISIGGTTYTFKTDKNSNFGGNVVDLTSLDPSSSDYMSQVASKLTEAASGNAVYSVGHDGSRITITEKENQSTYVDKNGDSDLTSLSKISDTLSWTAAPSGASGGLRLQIGDTADSYNQMTVSINDCHAAAIGIGEIDISTQDGASSAMTAIKNAINYVSDVRGGLGAIQNRLDHTINNLGVMQENIQDAESTIRDVDVAEEMMAYTKNNILVQSAQAMLAQANQLPQGVLQLLQ